MNENPHAARNPVERLVRADQLHRSRMHDEKGNRLPLGEFRHVPRNLWLTVRRKVTGQLPDGSWVAYNARARLEQVLRPDWVAIEFGSGMSTRWYAERVLALHSIEDNAAWYQRVRTTVPDNVRYDRREGAAYYDLTDYASNSVDFVVVDGIQRGQCMRAALPKLRSGGWIYLDNSDKDMTRPDGHVRQAETLLREAVNARGGMSKPSPGSLSVSCWPNSGNSPSCSDC